MRGVTSAQDAQSPRRTEEELVHADEARIAAETASLLQDADGYRWATAMPNPYGDGKAARRILEMLARAIRPGQAAPPLPALRAVA